MIRTRRTLLAAGVIAVALTGCSLGGSASDDRRPTADRTAAHSSSGSSRGSGSRSGTSGSTGKGSRTSSGADDDTTSPSTSRTTTRGSSRLITPASPLPWDPRTFDFDQVGRTSHASLRVVASDLKLSRRGQVLADRSVPDGVTVYANAFDAGVSQCSSRGTLRAAGDQARLDVLSCDVTASSGNAITGTAAVIRRSDITSTNDGITLTGGAYGPQSVIEYNKIWRDGTRLGDAHMDGIQFWQGGNTVIRRNWISGWSNSAIIIKSDLEADPGDGPVRNVLIEENYLANPSTYYTLYVRDGGFGRPQMITIRNNVFGPGRPISAGSNGDEQAVFVRTEQQRADAIAAGNAQAAEWIVWHGNIDAATGQEIVPPGGWLGTTATP